MTLNEHCFKLSFNYASFLDLIFKAIGPVPDNLEQTAINADQFRYRLIKIKDLVGRTLHAILPSFVGMHTMISFTVAQVPTVT